MAAPALLEGPIVIFVPFRATDFDQRRSAIAVAFMRAGMAAGFGTGWQGQSQTGESNDQGRSRHVSHGILPPEFFPIQDGFRHRGPVDLGQIEHVSEKLTDFSDKNMLHLSDFERVPYGVGRPLER